MVHYATIGSDSPQGLEGIHLELRRPRSWEGLTELEGALLETLRNRAWYSELDPEGTKARLLTLIRRDGQFPRLMEAALEEPPRARAILGAIGQELGEDSVLLDRLRASLHRLSRFDFGILRSLRHAREWQAK